MNGQEILQPTAVVWTNKVSGIWPPSLFLGFKMPYESIIKNGEDYLRYMGLLTGLAHTLIEVTVTKSGSIFPSQHEASKLELRPSTHGYKLRYLGEDQFEELVNKHKININYS